MSFVTKRVLLKTPLNPVTGYGRDGMSLAESLENMGAEVHLDPRFVSVPLTPVAASLLARPRAEHFEIALQHEYPGGIDFPGGVKRFADKVIAWSMYEFLGFGNETEMTDRLAERLSVYDLFLAYDDVTREAFLPYMDDPDRIKILQGGYDSEFWTPKAEQLAQRDWDGKFIFIMNGTMNQRKNPFAAINAFNKLKKEHGDAFDAELHMKTTSKVLHPAMMDAYPGLKIFYEQWTPEKIKEFYLSSHCLLAPSWGEGKNLPALEAGTTGIPSIVSDFGGHKQWARPEWAYLIGGKIVEHAPGQPSIRVDVDELAELMWEVYSNRTETKQKGLMAARNLPVMCDWSAVLERLGYMLEEIKPR